MPNTKIWIFVILILIAWIFAVVASGAGWNPTGISWSFTNSGAFGDSFGPLGSIMAAFAAYAAFGALHEQRTEVARLRARESEEDQRREKEVREAQEREIRRTEIERVSLFETTFFNLLGHFRDISKETDVGFGEHRKTSRDAFSKICNDLVSSYRGSEDLQAAWQSVLNRHKNDLNHYFRTLYHLVCYVEKTQAIDNYFYVRLIRALLSESELILLFANCAVGEGREKFHPLILKYALLHNVSEDSRQKWQMDKYYEPSAFETTP